MALPAHLASLDGFIELLVDDLVRECLAEQETKLSTVAGPDRMPREMRTIDDRPHVDQPARPAG